MDSGMERVCGREEDLMGFLYGELSDAESTAFRSHMKECVSCNSELKAFGDIRQSVISWRNESLNSFSTSEADVPLRERSAVAAIREFFALSPVWMKATVGFASVLFCIFAVLAVSSLRQSPSSIVATGEKQPSAAEIDALVNQRVKAELDRVNAETKVATATQDEVKPSNTSSGNSRGKRTLNIDRNDARRPLTRVEREQLAADLRLISRPNDNELELLSDAINQ